MLLAPNVAFKKRNNIYILIALYEISFPLFIFFFSLDAYKMIFSLVLKFQNNVSVLCMDSQGAISI